MTFAVEYTDPAGTALDINDGSAYVVRDVSGRGMPRSRRRSRGRPGRLDQVLIGALPDPRMLTLLMTVKGANPNTLLTNRRVLNEALNPWQRGLGSGGIDAEQGTLKLTLNNGDVRSYKVIYVGGAEVAAGELHEFANVGHWRGNVQLEAADAFPYDPTLITGSDTSAATEGGWTWPFTYPFTYGPAGFGVDVVMANDGDVLTYPVFEIDGPATDPTLTNVTSGEQVTINTSIPATQTLVVVMGPQPDGSETQVRIFLKDAGGNEVANRIGAYSGDSQFWGLRPGNNDILLSSIEASVDFRWEYFRRYIGV